MKLVWPSILVICACCAVGAHAVSAQAADDSPAAPSVEFERFLAGGFNVVVHSGLWVGEVPARPEESTYLWGGGDQYVGYGFGVNVDYHFSRYLAAHFDITRTMLSSPVAYAGGYSDGWWIESVSDFTVERVGPFTEDVNYWRNATGIRVGLKAYLMRTDRIAAWAGVYQGFYAWEITMLNPDRSQQYGTTTGTAMGLSLLNLGVDFWNRTRTLGMTLSLESGSPLTGDYAIENCLVNGWTYESIGGEHVLGPRRLGVSFNFVSPKKD